jgi:carbohydrate kinase (thermoresistant glucokinase family)
VTLILVMGVTAAGKSTVGRRLAERLGMPFHDADDFHPPANRQKMAENQALNDDDRRPWLEALATAAVDWERAGGAVLACSALKQKYRDVLLSRVTDGRTVFLEITPEQAALRLEARKGQHTIIRDYDRVLAGQFADLEPPEPSIRVPAVLPLDELVERVAAALSADGLSPPSRSPVP